MTDVDLSAQLQAVAAQVLTPDQLTAFTAVADAQKFAGENGEIDADRVVSNLRTVFGISDTPRTQQSQPNWGQGTGLPPGRQPGDHGRAALEKRHGVKNPSPIPVVNPGDIARAALEKRHHVRQQHQ
jgi:hypothetical protein